MATHVILNTVKMVNFFPKNGEISDSIIPDTIMSGETLDLKKHLCLQLGQYFQVHEKQLPRNSQATRTKGGNPTRS